MAHDHRTKTHVPTPPAGVDAMGDVAKALHMQGQFAAGHWHPLPTTQTTETVGGKKRVHTTFTAEESDAGVPAVAAPV